MLEEYLPVRFKSTSIMSSVQRPANEAVTISNRKINNHQLANEIFKVRYESIDLSVIFPRLEWKISIYTRQQKKYA
jgi:hypothetical protein